jgi:hypothetical protein
MCGIIPVCPDTPTSYQGRVVEEVAAIDQVVYPAGPTQARQTAAAAGQDTGFPAPQADTDVRPCRLW